MFAQDTLANKNAIRARHLTIRSLVTIGAVMSSITCDRVPTSPSLPNSPAPPVVTVPPPPPPADVSGTVWIHDDGGARRYAGADVYGWVQTNRAGGPMGRVVTDSEGRYLYRAPIGALVRIFVSGREYQPCAVTLDVSGDVTGDVHVISDREQLGARLPQSFLSQSPTLSGVVSEITPEGPRVLSDVHVMFDDTGTLGDVVTASTVTDSDGRYVLCGLARDKPATVLASKPGYPLVWKNVTLTSSATTLDIQF